jgi:hypothetical protein
VIFHSYISLPEGKWSNDLKPPHVFYFESSDDDASWCLISDATCFCSSNVHVFFVWSITRCWDGMSWNQSIQNTAMENSTYIHTYIYILFNYKYIHISNPQCLLANVRGVQPWWSTLSIDVCPSSLVWSSFWGRSNYVFFGEPWLKVHRTRNISFEATKATFFFRKGYQSMNHHEPLGSIVSFFTLNKQRGNRYIRYREATKTAI